MLGPLKEEPTKNAIKKISWDALRAHLDSIQLDDEGVDKLLGLMLRGDALILKRSDPAAEARRDILFDEAAKHLQRHGFDVAHDELLELLSLFKKIESGYQGIVAWMKQSDAAKYTADQRVGALLSRSNYEHVGITKQLHEGVEKGELQIGDTTLKDEQGGRYNVHAAHEAIVNALGSSLLMAAYEEKWFNEDGIVVVPSIPAASERERYASGSVQIGAVWWNSWNRTERSHRYLGATLEFFDAELPEWAASVEGAREAVTSRPQSSTAVLDYIANARLEKRLQERFAEFHLTGVKQLLEKPSLHAQRVEPDIRPLGSLPECEMDNALVSHFIEPEVVRELERGSINRGELNGDGASMTMAIELQAMDGGASDADQHRAWPRSFFRHHDIEAVHLHAFVAGAVNRGWAGSRQKPGEEESKEGSVNASHQSALLKR